MSDFGSDSKSIDINPEWKKAKVAVKDKVEDLFGRQVDPFTGKPDGKDFQGLPPGQEDLLIDRYKALTGSGK